MPRPKDGIVKHKVSATISSELLGELQAIAAAEKVTMAWLITRALERLVQEEAGPAPQLPLRRRG